MASNDKLIRIIVRMQDEMSAQMDRAASTMESAGKKMRTVGAVMSATVTAPIVAAGIAATRTAIQFEAAFADVAKTVDGTSEELNTLNRELVALATSGESPVSSLENAQMALFEIASAAGQLGIAQEDIVEFTDVMAQLAMTTDISGAQGARDLARFAGTAGVAMKDIRLLGDTINTLGNNMRTTESEILSFGTRMATLSQIGFAADEILAIGSAMASAGISSELGSTNFVKGAQEIALAAAQGGKGLDSLARTMNMSTAEAARFIQQNPAEAVLRFSEGLNNLPLAQQVAVLDSLNLKGVEAQRVFLTLAGSNDELAKALDLSGQAAIGNGALLAEAARRAGTTEGEINKLINNVRQLAADLGVALLPILQTVLQTLTPLVQSISAMSPATQQFIVIIAALVAAVGPLLMIIGQIMTMLPMLQAGFTAVAGVVGAISAPVLALVAALGLLAVMINRFGEPAWTAFKQLGIIIAMSLAEGTKAILGFIARLTGLDKLAKKIAEVFKNLGVAIMKSLIDSVKKYGDDMIKVMFDMARKAAQAIRDALKIRSPSRVMMDIGQQTVAGFQSGLGDGLNIPAPSVPTPALAGAGGGFGGGIYINNLNVPPGTTQQQVDEILRELGRRTMQRGARSTR